MIQKIPTRYVLIVIVNCKQNGMQINMIPNFTLDLVSYSCCISLLKVCRCLLCCAHSIESLLIVSHGYRCFTEKGNINIGHN